MNIAGSMGAKAIMTVFDPPEMPSQEPPLPLAAAMKNSNAIFRIVDGKGPLIHTKARSEATANGARYYMIGLFAFDKLKKGLSAVDLRQIEKRTSALSNLLGKATKATMTSPSGTKITMSLKGRGGIALHPLNAAVGHINYYAEAAISPVEGTANGIIVGDLAVLDWGYALKKPLRCTVKGGKIVDISGDKKDADRLREIISYKNGSNIAELGIGTSHMISGPVSGSHHDAAIIGTAHIGIGRNKELGGITASEVHFDILMGQAMVELDGRCVLNDGKLLI
jgi:leucyl aminopeptidase (aminopeptidase T)